MSDHSSARPRLPDSALQPEAILDIELDEGVFFVSTRGIRLRPPLEVCSTLNPLVRERRGRHHLPGCARNDEKLEKPGDKKMTSGENIARANE